MSDLLSTFGRHGWWIFWISIVTFVGSLAALPILVVRMPADYFVRDAGHGGDRSPRHPVVRIAVLIVKNLLGGVLTFAGIVMLFTPGQGILTILIGLSLLDLPGKRALERRLVGSPAVLDGINAIRARAGRPPLQLD